MKYVYAPLGLLLKYRCNIIIYLVNEARRLSVGRRVGAAVHIYKYKRVPYLRYMYYLLLLLSLSYDFGFRLLLSSTTDERIKI